MKIQNRNRAALLAIAGAYVLYLAYEMVRDQMNGASSMALWVCILAVVFFAAILQMGLPNDNCHGILSNMKGDPHAPTPPFGACRSKPPSLCQLFIPPLARQKYCSV